MNRQTALRILLAVVSISHLVLGVLAIMASPDTVVRLVATFYGAALEITPAMQHVLRILGAYMITVGLLAGFACFNPVRHASVIVGVVVLLVLRVVQRLILANEIRETFGVSSGHLWGQSAFFLALAAALLWLSPRVTTSTGKTEK